MNKKAIIIMLLLVCSLLIGYQFYIPRFYRGEFSEDNPHYAKMMELYDEVLKILTEDNGIVWISAYIDGCDDTYTYKDISFNIELLKILLI